MTKEELQKEAEERTEEKYVCNEKEIMPLEAIGYKKGFKDGAEFGYNMANDWHYVKSEEDLPKDNSEYLLLLEHGIRAFGYYNGKFWESWNGDLSWQEVKAYYDVPVPDEDRLNDKKE